MVQVTEYAAILQHLLDSTLHAMMEQLSNAV